MPFFFINASMPLPTEFFSSPLDYLAFYHGLMHNESEHGCEETRGGILY